MIFAGLWVFFARTLQDGSGGSAGGSPQLTIP
jgi:hypothetical protein